MSTSKTWITVHIFSPYLVQQFLIEASGVFISDKLTESKEMESGDFMIYLERLRKSTKEPGIPEIWRKNANR